MYKNYDDIGALTDDVLDYVKKEICFADFEDVEELEIYLNHKFYDMIEKLHDNMEKAINDAMYELKAEF